MAQESWCAARGHIVSSRAVGPDARSPIYRSIIGLDRTALARIPNLRPETSSPFPGSSGYDLFANRAWDWLIAATYCNFALVEPDQVTIVSPTSYEIRDRNYRLVPNPTLPRDHLRAAMQEMRRFYR